MHFPENALQRRPTRKELLDVSLTISNQFSPDQPVSVAENDIDMLLTRQQLRDISQNINLYYAPRIVSNTDTLILLPIDPEHFYVSWNLADYHEIHQNQDNDLKLKIFSQGKNKQTHLVYERTVAPAQTQQRISFDKTEQGVVYRASLGKYYSENGFISLVKSNEIYSFYDTKKMTKDDNRSQKMDFVENSNDFETIPPTFSRQQLKRVLRSIKANHFKKTSSGLGKLTK